MSRRDLLTKLTAAALAALLPLGKSADAKPNAGLYAHCSQACQSCHDACRACHAHCAGMVRAGMAQHVVTERLSADCMDLCSAAAGITARRGPMSAAACRACLAACRACGAECARYPHMAPMSACAASCVACAAACEAMIAALR